ncbi:MAG: hypothetical protein ABI587_06170 [Gemmatimonadales bacterium]
MRSYWLKIGAKALGIFAVGMVLITGVRTARTKVTHAINSSDPIAVPLIGLIPFRLDSSRLGSLRKVQFLRSDPQHVSGVRVVIKLADSITPERLRNCQLALDDLNNLNDRTTFRCQAPGEVPAGLSVFGVVALENYPDTFQLLLPQKATDELRATTFTLNHNGFHVESPRDTVAEALAQRSDSMSDAIDQVIDARSDSISDLKELAAAIDDSSTEVGAQPRRTLERRADSVRSVMRAMTDRMKRDEARRDALGTMHGLSPADVDSISSAGIQLGDSIRRMVARELQQAQIEVRTARRGTVRVAPPVPPNAPVEATP